MGYSKDMLIIDLLEANPKTAAVLASFGLPCQECVVADFETLEQGVTAYGLDLAAVLQRLDREAPTPAKAKKAK
jgi:hybrid cluster-associated redox disulfide protein